jgi:nucleotide-binding universal stress UspA family protein
MALKDLLVHVVNEADSAPTIDAALGLAVEHDAHLIGLGIRAPVDLPVYAEGALPGAVLEMLQTREDERLEKAQQLFESKVKHAGRSDRAEWRIDEGMPYQTLALHARYADLSIVPQSKADTQDYRFADLSEDLLVGSGRPVLIIPAAGARKPIGHTVVVAWNASRESARAVSDAMPILEKAKAVEIFTAGDQDIGDLPGADIAAHLARHRIRVGVYRSTATETSVGDALLNRAAEIGADLIVMGGYGRARFREFILGGVTRHILEHLTVPVQMSH